jgi:tetratricopeptide (TPR) repeat protein
MDYYDDEKKRITELSTEDIETIRGGVYSDHIVLSALDEMPDVQSKEAKQRRLALMKLVCRSPQVDDFFAYDQIILDLLYALIDSGQSDVLLKYALMAWLYFLKQGFGLDLTDYLNIARGFLYQGRVDVFVAFLRRALNETHLLDYHLTTLIEDFVRLNELDLARYLDVVGKKALPDDWHENDLTDTEHAENPPAFINEALRQDIRDLITPESITQDENKAHLPALYDRTDLIVALSSKPSDKAILLWVPDMLCLVLGEQFPFNATGDVFVDTLASLQSSMLPELSLLGDALEVDREPVFNFVFLGKTCGYHFSSLVDMATDTGLSPDVRSDAAKGLMKIVAFAPEYRDEVLEILENLMKTTETRDDVSEIIVTGIVANLLDTDLYELKPAVVKAFMADIVSPEIVRRNSFTDEWDLPELEDKKVKGARTILLKCGKCGKAREYDVDYVLVMHMRMTDWGSDYIFFNHPIVCKKCGARENYELSPLSVIKLFPMIVMPEDAEDLTKGIDEMVYIIPNPKDLFFDGYSPVIIDELRRKVIAQGVNTLEPLSQGEYYRVTGKFEESLSAFRKAYREDPRNRVAALALAMAEHDYGDRNKAKTYYYQALRKGKVNTYQSDPLNEIAVMGLSALDMEQNSPYPYPKNRDKRTLLENRMRAKKRRHR